MGRTPWTAVLVIAAVATGSLLVAAGRYGYERDELYNWVAGQHLSFGYIDTPPLVPLLARARSRCSAIA